jgi:DNA repair protein RadC
MPQDSAERGLQICGIPEEYWSAVGIPKRSLILGGFPCPHLQGLHRRLEQLGSTVLRLDVVNSMKAQEEDAALVPAFLYADPLKLPLTGASFDLVVSCWTVHYAPDPFAHFREILRVLVPGGGLFLLNGMDQPGTPEQDLHRAANHLMMEMDQAMLRRQISFFSPAEVIELVHSLGFTDVQARKIPHSNHEDAPEVSESLRENLISTFTSIYPRKLQRFPQVKDRWSKRLQTMVKRLQTSPLAAQPHIVVSAKKKPDATAEIFTPLPDAARKAHLQGFGSGYLISEERSGYHLRFRELPDEFKPREKLVLHGPAVLKNHELLAVLLVSGTTKENVLELSHRLIQEYGSRAIAQERSVRRLQETLNIGLNKACQIVAAFELGRRFFEEPMRKAPTILTADDAYEYVRDMAKFTKEHFRGLYLNTRNRVIRDEIISIGTLNMSVVHPREVFLPAVEFTAAAIILAHNHPSGDPTPSEEDLAITHQMVEAGRVMGIEVFDHLIIGDNSYISLQQEGKLK